MGPNVKCVRARINQVFLVLDFSFVLSRSLSQNRYFWDPSQSAGSNLGKVVCLPRKRGNCAFLSRKLIVGELGLAYM